jgi:hypothetical protein
MLDDPYDEIRATPEVPWKIPRTNSAGRQSVCQMGAPTPVGPHHAPTDTITGHQSADRSETGRSSITYQLKTERSHRRRH